MQILFRCSNCEIINEIQPVILYRFCKNCGKIITYSAGEAILDDNSPKYNQFRNLKKLDTKTASKFFEFAEEDIEKIEQIISNNTPKEKEWLDVPNGSFVDIITFLLINSKTQSLDELIWNCKLLDVSISKLEQIITKMKNEGLLYQPTNWSLKPV